MMWPRRALTHLAFVGIVGTIAACDSTSPAPRATRLAFSVEPSSTAAGAIVSPAVTVSVLQADGNLSSGSSASITLEITAGTGTAGAALGGTLTRAAVNGVATFNDLTLDKAGTGYSLTAKSGSLSAATSTTFAIEAGSAATLSFVSQPTTVAKDSIITPSVTIVVQDAFGNPVTASTLTVSVAIASGTGNPAANLGGILSRASVGGVSAFDDLTVDREGTDYAIVATANGLTAASSDAFDVIVPAASLHLVYSQLEGTDLTIWRARGDGTDKQYLNVGTGPTQHNGVIIARGAYQDNRMYAMNGDGTNRHEILPAGPSYTPDFSPGGDRFVLMYGDCGGGLHPVAVANSDGTGLVIHANCTDQSPRWSPLGDRLLYAAGGTIYTAKTDGSDVQPVIALTATMSGLAWATDGTALLFSWKNPTSPFYQMYRVNLDGSGLQVVTSTAADDLLQDWSAEGNWVLFWSNRSGSWGLWAMKADGSAASEIVMVPQGEQARWKK